MNGRIVLVGDNSWTDFAASTLREVGEATVVYPEDSPGAMTCQDLVILSPSTDHLPSQTIGLLMSARGPLRILVVDVRADYARAGDAARACAIGYQLCTWNRQHLIDAIDCHRQARLPDEGAIARRFGT